MKKIMLVLILGFFLISLISATQTIAWNPTTGRIDVSSDSLADAVSFQDIYEYFQDNPVTPKEFDIPQRYGGDPYELCENNSGEWSGLNGMSNLTDNSSDYTKNNYSISAIVESLPSSQAITSSMSDTYWLYIYMSDTSNFTLGDEVKLTRPDGTTIITKVRYYSVNSYLRGYPPKGFLNLASVAGGTVEKPLCLVWNNDRVENSFPTTITDQMRFSAKSNGTSSPRITDVIVRNIYTEAGDDYSHLVYGAYTTQDFNLTSSWQDFNITIRDMLNFHWKIDYPGRGYWTKTKKLYFFIDNVSVGDKVWLDGTRFTNTDVNPKSPAQNQYVFSTGLNVLKYFKDSGFNVRFDLLETWGLTATGVQFTNTGDYGDIQLGDYDGSTSVGREGGVMSFNHFCIEDNGAFFLAKVQSQGMTYTNFKNAYGGFNFGTASNSIFRNCNFINNMNFFNVNNVSIENCAWMGGRYFSAFPTSMSINGITVYQTSTYAFYVRKKSTGVFAVVKNAKIISNTSGYVVVNANNHGITELNANSTRFVNFDISECNNPIYSFRWTGGYTLPLNVLFSFSMDLKAIDENGNPLENAKIILRDKNGKIIFDELTDVNGTISEQYVDYYRDNKNENHNIYFDNSTAWTTYYPYTLTISKSDYSTYNTTFFSSYDRSSNIVKNGADWTISLESRDWDYTQTLAWKILNKTDTTILKLTNDGNLAIAGELYENTNTAPPNVIYKIANVLWLTKSGDLYLVKELMEVII